ncbi:CDP-diacylglycerol--inositol 3-phosphatidyltransferase, putative [Plasmodium berghei]|uniref:CDP-diacylglycerol--inositol 3-phosphatidyltransferase n=2 Tax=Plasmodium berghei TaxID=5821 RepID=A0A509AQ26_PLABA|nr:CDP-diacylglycerol--inositol 3-phosphatidyltransferase, putative [Plasmodium berghei ANKA]CXJ13976.1 CDP-diacylglycerol--inositol 3-phosphatidyltransferase, putative [Plasmodium berghei]SCM26165.1 CDP-diacylglycerol--inositol 3-phosphatidyltransferase, putative [Plasmodium berghei]SCN28311.1 CDP-diacylglycerol--inositol 3-phosphatidyltransferase, putative [Plasmodium berghei]SCO62509.1 CDP-diacylglycerol--inositol 3-phosphatidyltransferase, putative [Plasmodium berghei]SCO64067.1 CDP-diacyl|eukprot:XP_034423963.1 CDP-diacylglycerol--inositol 3-phosphatidyltransferase, putative [Plasmodium berghei ANKA]
MQNKNVYLYVPNIIGYIRIILALIAFIVCKKNLAVFTLFYGTSQLLDALDGWTARKFNQTSCFGQILDQITDRLSTCILYLLNGSVYDNYIILIGLLMIADIGGHYIHAASCAIAGNKTHKKIENGNKLLKLYYEKPSVMVACIIAYESFWVSSYILKITDVNHIFHIICNYTLKISFPLAAFKAITNISQGIYGARSLVEIDHMKMKNKNGH